MMRASARLAAVILGLAIGLSASAPYARAQAPSRLPLVAILEPGSASTPSAGVAQFTQVLGELGWVDGRAVRIETRYLLIRADRVIE